MSWLMLAHGLLWVLLPEKVKTDPKSEIWVRRNSGKVILLPKLPQKRPILALKWYIWSFFRKKSWLTPAHGLWWLLLPKVVKTDPKSEIWVRQNLGSNSNSSAIIGPKTANFGPKVVFLVIFGQILVFLAHLAPCPTKKEKPWWLFLWWSTKTFLTDCHNCDSWPKDGRFWLKIAIFGLSGPLLALMADMLTRLSQK